MGEPRRGDDQPDRDQRRRDERVRRGERAPVEQAEPPRQLAVLAERVREPADPRDGGRGRHQQDQGAGDPDVDVEHVAEPDRQLRAQRRDDPHQRRPSPRRAERRVAVLDRERREPDDRDQHVDHDHRAERAEEAARQVAARLAGLLGEVRDRLEPRVGEHRERQREGELVPGRRGADRDPVRQQVAGEEEAEAEHDEHQLGDEVDDRDGEPDPVEARPADEPDRRDPGDDPDRRDDVPGLALEPVQVERVAEVVRQEQRRERDHDQVVEEQHPAGREAGEVVERDARERGGAAGLGDRRRSLRVRERDEQEEDAGEEQDGRGEPERLLGDDPEREVDRRGDLAVGDRGERGDVEHPLQARQLAGHLLLRPSAARAGRCRAR